MMRLFTPIATLALCLMAAGCDVRAFFGEDAVAPTDELCQRNDAGWCPP